MPNIQIPKHLLAWLALFAMVGWFCDEIIFSAQLPFFRDLPTYFYPIKFSVAEAFQRNQLPLWDYRIASGFPVMAGLQSAVFYPPTIAYFLFDFLTAIRISFVFHYALAAIGAYTLFRSWKLPIYCSLVGSVLFTFGGTTVSLSNLLNHFQSAVWLPWLIFAWERLILLGGVTQIAILSLIALFQILAGSPEIFALSIALVSIDTWRVAGREGRIDMRTVSVRGLVAGVVILGLGMIQWLPTAELLTESRRDEAIHMSEALSWSLQPSSLLSLFVPTLEADPSLTVGIRLIYAKSVPFLLSHYIGIVGIFGFCSWFYGAQQKERLLVLMFMAGSLVLALGSGTPIYPLLYEWLPPLRIMRFPEKFWFLCSSLMLFTIVRGIQCWDEKPTSGAWWKIAGTISACFAILYVTSMIRPAFWVEFIAPPTLMGAQTDPKTIATILVSLEKQLVISLALAIILALHRFDVLRYGLLTILLVAVTFFDVSSVTKPFHFLRDQKVIVNAPRILGVPSGDHERIFYYPPGKNMHPSFMKVAGNPTYEKATEIAINNLLPNAGVLYGFEYFQDIDALGRRSYTDFLMFINSLQDQNRGKLLRLLNVRYVVAFHSLEIPDLSLVRHFPEHFSALYQVNRPVPRTYITQRVFYEPEPHAALARMASETFEPMLDVVMDAPISLEPQNSFVGKATLKHYENRRVLIQAQLSHPGILILADSYYPGWKVFVNGKQQVIHRANFLFRGVELARGTHKVEFVYDPVSLKVGMVVSIVTIILLLITVVVDVIRQCASRAT